MPAWTEPRSAPPTLLPAVAGGIVVAVALPIFLLAGWRVTGWGIGAVLWLASDASASISGSDIAVDGARSAGLPG